MIWEEEAIDVYYKGKLPKWLTKYEVLAAAKDEYYVVQESDFLENEWLHLYAEIALYSNWKWHATRKSGEESPHLKLKANNAIFYMSFKGSGDHPSGKHYEYQAIVRKTMDGKPGHIRLEVDSWEGIPSHLIGEDEPPESKPD
ncbi:Protein MS5 [Arabidopsis thaliana x Arabidopsis arenosa]|uniref:Protein MS5 n=1 Tax=Arabidopsis thaliana x Arabidopsis arenosa TaxID=1240361 RepID=A0A8T2A709_9BRAS|nr:Protein MS5 [Arabidopsis thaliana x Arabidopsis arenosa]